MKKLGARLPGRSVVGVVVVLAAAGLVFFFLGPQGSRRAAAPFVPEIVANSPGDGERSPPPWGSGRTDRQEVAIGAIPSSPARTRSDARLSLPLSTEQGSLGARRLAELKNRAEANPDTTVVVFPVSAEQREDFIARVLEPQVQQIEDVCYSEIPERARARAPKDTDAATRDRIAKAIRALSDSEFAYRLELNEAIKKEVHTADLSQPKRLTREIEGTVGSMSVVVQGHPWGDRPATIQIRYLVDYAVYERVGKARESLLRTQREYSDLLHSLSGEK